MITIRMVELVLLLRAIYSLKREQDNLGHSNQQFKAKYDSHLASLATFEDTHLLQAQDPILRSGRTKKKAEL